MSDEQAFRSELRANPGDETTRMAYSDWLRDQGREADADLQLGAIRGWRAWVKLGRKPHGLPTSKFNYLSGSASITWLRVSHFIPIDWADAVEMDGKSVRDENNPVTFMPLFGHRKECSSEEIVEAAIEGFARLPLERQDELLNGYEWRDGVLVRVGAVAG
jgi:uncharacterized protein (TIGR02996 family)